MMPAAPARLQVWRLGLIAVTLLAIASAAFAQVTVPAAPPPVAPPMQSGTAPASSSQPAPAQTPSTPRVVKRTVLLDGSVQLEYSDGTTRRVAQESGASSSGAPTNGDTLSPIAPPEWLKDEATGKAFLEAMGEYYRYRTSGLRHRSRVFEWQLTSSKVIFATVLMLVGAGMVFAAIQFRVGLKRPDGAAADAPTQIDLSAASVKVSSPVLGVIILVISLAFFYLYLVYVYPISEIV